MSKKARRRPSWKTKPHFYLNLICKDTGKLLETIRFAKGAENMIRMLHRLGPEEMERLIAKGLEDTARKVLDDHRTQNQNT